MKRKWIIPVLLVLTALVGWSLVNQYRRSRNVGERVAGELIKIRGPLRSASVIMDYLPTGAKPTEFKIQILWRNKEGVIAEAGDHKDVTRAKAGEVRVYRYVDDAPQVRRWITQADVEPLRKALMQVGYMPDRARELIRQAQEYWLYRSDEEILLALLTVDEGSLVRSHTSQFVCLWGVALMALDVTGPVGVMTLPTQKVYVFQERQTADFKKIAECRWVAFGPGGKEKCHGDISLPRERQTETMTLLYDALVQMENDDAARLVAPER